MINNFFKKHFFPSGWINTWRPYFIIFALGFILYGQTLFFDFTYFDDNALNVDKIDILSDARNIGRIFSSDVFFSTVKSYYRPFLNLSFMLDAQIGGAMPFVYHFSNILIHCLAACLVFCLFRRLFKKPDASFAWSLIFLVHPVLVQAVAWLPGRNDSLLAVFSLAAFLAFLSFLRRPQLKKYLAYLALLFGALLVKETAVAIPVLAILYFWLIDKGETSRQDRWLLAIGSAAVGFVWLLLRSFVLDKEPTNYLSIFLGSSGNLSALLTQIGKMVMPVNLSVLPITLDSTIVYGIISLVLIILALVFSRQKRWRYIFFGIAWFFFFLFPTFIRLADSSGFLEHRVYLPLIGLIIVLNEVDWFRNLFPARRLGRLALGAVLVIFMAITVIHSRDFRDRITFWQTAVSDSPHSPLAQRNLGAMYYLDGDSTKALEYYRAALALNPQEAMAHNNIGIIRLAQGDYDEAEKEFLAELEIAPNYDKAFCNLGEVYYRQNQPIKAAFYWQKALQANPYYSEAYLGLLKLEER